MLKFLYRKKKINYLEKGDLNKLFYIKWIGVLMPKSLEEIWRSVDGAKCKDLDGYFLSIAQALRDEGYGTIDDFAVCGDCQGSGWDLDKIKKEDYDYKKNPLDCPSCQGRGIIRREPK
jgi:hypothetical protein